MFRSLGRCLRLIAPAALSGCVLWTPTWNPEPPQPPVEPLPALPIEQTVPPPILYSQENPIFPDVLELRGHGLGEPITLTAADVEVSALVSAIAETLGISIVVGPEVEGTLSLRLEEVPALIALRTVLDEAGLVLVGRERAPLWPPVVFYTLPVNVQTASPELVQARFGVSREVAEIATQR